MIKTKIKAFCDRRSTQKAIIQIEVESFSSNHQGTSYVVNDYILNDDGSKQFIGAKTVFYDADKLNYVSDLLEQNNDYSGLSRNEAEWQKVIDGLLLDTQTNLFEDGETIYRLTPADWEKTIRNDVS